MVVMTIIEVRLSSPLPPVGVVWVMKTARMIFSQDPIRTTQAINSIAAAAQAQSADLRLPNPSSDN